MFDPVKFRDAAMYESGVSRRLFLAYAASLSTLPWLGERARAAGRKVALAGNPFSVGVASGDPVEDGFVLWTRLAPEPLEPGGGMPRDAVDVTWEVASDESMRNVVARGNAVATPQLGHSVHVEVSGLAPDRWYWYRFRAGDAESPIGRTRTMPLHESNPRQVRFAFASCQDFEDGLYTAYEHMAKDDLDLVFHLGDYIYESRGEEGKVRKHIGKEIESLDDYRIRHAQYKSDPMLQEMHARCPWMVVWDDHEFDNDCANDICEIEDVDPVEFLIRRANAYQAYYEMMPLRRTSLPRGPHMQLYRNLSFGRLAEFMVLDTRQYRSDQPHAGGKHDIDADALTTHGTMLGSRQFGWLARSLTASLAQWNVLAQQVLMGMVDFEPGAKHAFSMEKWPGYLYERQRLLRFLDERRVPNPVVLTGDIHSNWVNDLRVDDRKADTPVIATEFAGTSISSDGNGVDRPELWKSIVDENACVRFFNDERGYVRCTVTQDEWRSDFRVVSDILRPGGSCETRASYVVEAGQPGAKKA